MPQEGEKREGPENRSFFANLLARGGVTISKPDKERRKLMRRFKRAKQIPSEKESSGSRPDSTRG